MSTSAPQLLGFALTTEVLAEELSAELSSHGLAMVHVVTAADLKESARSDQCIVVSTDRLTIYELTELCESHWVTVLADVDEVADLLRQLPLSTSIVMRQTPAAVIARELRNRVLSSRREIDPLTGVLTRNAFYALLASREEAPGAHSMIHFDIDFFKAVNDTHGHMAGDQVLRIVAARLLDLAPSGAPLGRIGGELFALYLPAEETAALAVAESILAAFRARPSAGIDVRLSAGLATLRQGLEGVSLSRFADEALYGAKAQGRDRALTYAQLAAAAHANNRDVSVEGFENRTKVIAGRVAEAISARGRRVFHDLQQRADRDPVTGLFSRGYLDRRLPGELKRGAKDGVPMTVALVDIDHFGDVNKSYGWPTGDQALRDVSSVISENVRRADWVARYGGEELCIVMFDIEPDQASTVLDRLRTLVANHESTATDGRQFRLTVSIGAVSLPSGGPAQDAIEAASAALLAAKRAGRDRLVMAPPNSQDVLDDLVDDADR